MDRMRRAGVFLAIFLALGGCQRETAREISTESRTPPGLAGRFFPPEGWAWGVAPGGHRYGVSAPSAGIVGQVLILPGQGESAEAWFETARDLNARRYVVWVLDPPGDGASVAAMIGQVIRPHGGPPLILLTQDEAALPALSALSRERPQVAALVLSSPVLPPARPPVIPAGDEIRGATLDHWRKANPDLRAKAGWSLRKGESAKQVRDRLARLATPTLILTGAQGETSVKETCQAIPSCRGVTTLETAGAMHLDADRVRLQWLAAIEGFAAGASRPAPVR
jgi:lysophospholipase